MKETRKVTYIDMIRTWSTTLLILYTYLSCQIGILVFVTDPSCDSLGLGFCLIVVSLGLGLVWLPGLIVAMIRKNAYDYIATTNPDYTESRYVLNGNPRVIRETLRQGFDSWVTGVMYAATTVLTGSIVILSAIGCLSQNQRILNFALGLGIFFAWSGAVLASSRLTYDIIQVWRQKRKKKDQVL